MYSTNPPNFVKVLTRPLRITGHTSSNSLPLPSPGTPSLPEKLAAHKITFLIRARDHSSSGFGFSLQVIPLTHKTSCGGAALNTELVPTSADLGLRLMLPDCQKEGRVRATVPANSSPTSDEELDSNIRLRIRSLLYLALVPGQATPAPQHSWATFDPF